MTRHPASARRRLAIIGGASVLGVALSVGVMALMGGGPQTSRGQEPPRLSSVLSQTLQTRGLEAAVAQYRTLRAQGFPGLRESEADTNRLGYELLAQGQSSSAIQVFQLNVEVHPRSSNVFDSLGEAHLVAGNRALAIEAYRQAVAINPRKKTSLHALGSLTGERKPYRPLVLLHVLAGSISILFGAVALSLRKGSRRHALVGTVFFVSMLVMSSSAVYMAVREPHGEMINLVMGILTLYLVSTAWVTARRRNEGTNLFDWAALLVALVVAAGLARFGFEAVASPTGKRFGASSGLFFFFGGVALLAAGLDLRMIVRGGVSGAARIARHLWRMCAALFIAATSLFLGQPQLFPYAVRRSGVLVVPSVLIVGLLLFWLMRVLFTKSRLVTRAGDRPEVAAS